MKKLIRRIKLFIKRRIVSFLLCLVENDYKEFQVIIENKNDFESKAILFGYNKFYNKKNFGTDEGVIIDCFEGYENLLCETQLKTNISCIRFLNYSNNYKLSECSPIVIRNSSIKFLEEIPLHPFNYFKQGQNQTNIVDINKKIIINGNRFLELTLKPRQKIALVFFNFKTNY